MRAEHSESWRFRPHPQPLSQRERGAECSTRLPVSRPSANPLPTPTLPHFTLASSAGSCRVKSFANQESAYCGWLLGLLRSSSQREALTQPLSQKERGENAAVAKKCSMQGGWLFKEEPSCYSFADLEKDGGTWWTGVRNALARKHLRSIQVGDRVLFYHTGKERQIVGEMRVVDGPTTDPKSDDAKSVRVKVAAVSAGSGPCLWRKSSRIRASPTGNSCEFPGSPLCPSVRPSGSGWRNYPTRIGNRIDAPIFCYNRIPSREVSRLA